MIRVLYLAARHVAYHQVKTAILTICLTVTIVVPLSAHLLIAHYDRAMRARAAATPFVIGAHGNRFDLVLKALYFGSARVEPITMSEVEALRASDLALAIPLDLTYTARGYALVGTTLDYFDFRGLRVQAGTPPLHLGQAVLGAELAAQLGLVPGDALFSDQTVYYDITRTYPLKMPVAGVLAKTGTPDDWAVFVDLKTTWVIAGLVHGHQNVVQQEADPGLILTRTETEVVTNPGIHEYQEISAENIASFHAHAPPEQLPLSAIIVIPHDRKAATILQARYREPERATRMLAPDDVIAELMGRVLEVQRVFNASFALVALTTLLFVILVVLLSQRIRQREMETMFKLGCSRGMTVGLQVAELGIVLGLSVILALVLAAGTVLVAPGITRLL